MAGTKKICIITSGGGKKRDSALPARRLFKSPRITAVHNRRDGHDMYILSSKYGLLHPEKIIEPYDMVLDREMVRELLPGMIPVLQGYDKVIFFKAGARKLYAECMEEACEMAGTELDSFGFGFMGGIGDLEGKIRAA